MAIELHTERLKKETGADKIVCDVLHHDVVSRRRLINIISETDGKRTVQTVAYTFLLPHRWTDDIANIDQHLKQGNLMGQTFRDRGYTVRQNQLLKMWLPVLSKRIMKQFGHEGWRILEIEVYEFWAGDVTYGFIVEFKHPANRHSPTRKSAGLHTALQLLGFSRRRLFEWLDDSKATGSPRIMMARTVGAVTGIVFYLRSLWHAPRLIKDD